MVTSTPATDRADRDVIEVNILVSDGISEWQLSLHSDMLLNNLLVQVAKVTGGSCIITHLGVEGSWCIKEGSNKYLLEYLDNQDALDKVFVEVCKHCKE